MFNLSPSQLSALNYVSKKLQINPLKLWALIQFESKWKTDIKNPYSTARGLIQFTDSTARSLGYENSFDLVSKNQTIEKQLKGPVLKYLEKFKPFISDQSLYMAVFYPKYRYESPYKVFPDSVIAVNKNIKNPQDYIKRVNSKLPLIISSPILLLMGMWFLYEQFKKDRKK